MKQYTTPDQTAKLIELGFEKPKIKLPFEVTNDELGYTYSIGELIEMLPKADDAPDRRFIFDDRYWIIDWDMGDSINQTMSAELIDALFDMVVNLKEEGVI